MMAVTARSFVWACIAAASLSSWTIPAAAAAAAADSLDALLDRAMATGLTPGIAVAVVRGDHVLWTGVRGVADLDTKRAVTPETRFYIASTTKAITALAAAQLAGRGELDLDEPLSAALPGVRLHEGLSADSIRVVDLLTHTHGIESNGPVTLRMSFTGDYSYADLMRALATQGPARSGRTFAYSNLGYELAGIVLDPAHEGGWKRVVEREVLVPLGMHRTTAYRSALPNARLAMPHRTTTDGLERIALAKQDSNMGPAGGLFSTAGDLARLVVAELNGGRLDGRECVPSGVIAATQRARVPQQRVVLGYRRFAWGLGWDLGTCDGDTVVHRFGEFPGFASRVSFMPARGVGVVVLSNGGQGGSMLADAVAAALYDRLLERPDARAREVARLDTLTAGVQELRVALAADRERRAARSQTLAHPLAAYAGTYASPEWGTLRLRVRGSHLEAAMGVARSAVEVYDAATEKLRVELFGGGSVIEAVFAPGESRARAMRIMGATLARR